MASGDDDADDVDDDDVDDDDDADDVSSSYLVSSGNSAPSLRLLSGESSAQDS